MKDAAEVSTPYGSFLLKNVSVTSTGVVSGTVTNNTTRSWRYTQFLIYLKDKNGKYLNHGTQPYSLVTGARDLSKGQTGQLESSAYYLAIPGRFTDFAIQFNPTNSNFIYNYVFNLVAPRKNSSPTFADDTISIAFSATSQQIGFLLTNESKSPISINWDQTAYIDFDGSSHRVIHEGVRFLQRDAPQPATTVPPGANIREFVYPSDRVSWSDLTGEWIQAPIWPSILSPGQAFGVFLSIDANGTPKSYMFTIEVTDVQF